MGWIFIDSLTQASVDSKTGGGRHGGYLTSFFLKATMAAAVWLVVRNAVSNPAYFTVSFMRGYEKDALLCSTIDYSALPIAPRWYLHTLGRLRVGNDGSPPSLLLISPNKSSRTHWQFSVRKMDPVWCIQI